MKYSDNEKSAKICLIDPDTNMVKEEIPFDNHCVPITSVEIDENSEDVAYCSHNLKTSTFSCSVEVYDADAYDIVSNQFFELSKDDYGNTVRTVKLHEGDVFTIDRESYNTLENAIKSMLYVVNDEEYYRIFLYEQIQGIQRLPNTETCIYTDDLEHFDFEDFVKKYHY